MKPTREALGQPFGSAFGAVRLRRWINVAAKPAHGIIFERKVRFLLTYRRGYGIILLINV